MGQNETDISINLLLPFFKMEEPKYCIFGNNAPSQVLRKKREASNPQKSHIHLKAWRKQVN